MREKLYDLVIWLLYLPGRLIFAPIMKPLAKREERQEQRAAEIMSSGKPFEELSLEELYVLDSHYAHKQAVMSEFDSSNVSIRSLGDLRFEVMKRIDELEGGRSPYHDLVSRYSR